MKFGKPSAKSIKVTLFSSAIFLIGASGYYLLEIWFRGFSHWTMALCGGTCLCLIFWVNRRLSKRSLILRAAIGAIIITVVEFITGCLVNLWLHWNVWDYSHLPLNLLGQISLAFSALWFLLCLPVCYGCSLTVRLYANVQKTLQKNKAKGRSLFS